MRPKVQRTDHGDSWVAVPIQAKNKKDNSRRQPKRTEKFNQLTAFQYFLASLCDAHNVANGAGVQLGLRYQQTPEVIALLSKLKMRKLSYSDVSKTHPNVIFSVLKEALSLMPPTFPTEELLCFHPSTSEELVYLYISGLIDSLEIDVAHIAYLVSKSLSMLINHSGRKQQSLIDTLVIFTPIFFPACQSQTAFLRATRALLLMLEHTDQVFPTHVIERGIHSDNLLEMIEAMQADCEYDSGFESATHSEGDHMDYDHFQLEVHNNPAYYMITFDV